MKRSTYRIATTAAATVGVFSLLATPMAWAQEAEPPLVVTGSEGTCGRVTLNATAESGAYTIAVFSGPNAGGQVEHLGTFDSTAEGMNKTFTLDEDAYDGDGFVSWATIAGPEQDFYVHGAVGVKTDCTTAVEPEPEPEPEPTPTPEPDPSEPAPEPEPAPSDDPDPTAPVPPVVDPADPAQVSDNPAPDAKLLYENCADVRAAGKDPLLVTQEGYDKSLDSDNDGVACEVAEDTKSSDKTFSQTGQIPVGSAETGQA